MKIYILTASILSALLLTGCGSDDTAEAMIKKEQNAANQAIINNTITENLTNEQKYTLAYMWNEEKLAKDIYLELNKIYPSNTLYNIATNAETQHQASIEGLVEKYDLNILNPIDFQEHYSAEELSVYAPGEYSIDAIQSLYDVLYAKGSQSLQDALEVGCMVEVTDIEDLEVDLIVNQSAPDLVLVFENLLAGSYAHYWSFNTALKNIGISEGCCVLGEDFCKTSEEYPQGTTGSQNGNGQQGGKH